MRIVFMGTPDFAVESLKQLYEAGHDIVAVVSQPDKPSGRGMKLLPTPTKSFAIEKNIPVYQPEKVRNNEEFLNELKVINPDVIVVVAHGKILPKEILELPKFGCINVHGSLLPKYRGAAPIQWAIINGERETGVTTMKMDIGMDTGDILLKKSLPIERIDTYGTLYEKLKILGGKAIIETLKNIEKLIPIKQGDDFSIAPMIFKKDTEIDWNKTALEIENLVRGVNPMPGAWTTLNENKIKIWKCEKIDFEENKENIPGAVILSNSKQGLFVKTGNGIISILEIQAPNSKRMNILDYLRGNSIEVGTNFIKL